MYELKWCETREDTSCDAIDAMVQYMMLALGSASLLSQLTEAFVISPPVQVRRLAACELFPTPASHRRCPSALAAHFFSVKSSTRIKDMFLNSQSSLERDAGVHSGCRAAVKNNASCETLAWTYPDP